MQSYLENLNNYENALEAISSMIGICIASIYEEEARSSPDAAKIEKLMEQAKAYHQERLSLNSNDHDAVMKVMEKYDPIIREHFAKPHGG